MSVSQTHGVIRRSSLTDTPQRAESLDAYKICRAGDLVFNKMSIRAGAMGLAPEDGLVTYHYEVMRPRSGSDPRFIVYLMKSQAFTAELVRRERGIGAGDASANVRTTEVPYKVLRNIECYVPGLSEQRAIADYLDRETQKIDELITEQYSLIETLVERRQSVADALLMERGVVFPSAMSSSNIVVPTGWSTAMLGSVLDQLTNGYVGPTRDILVDDGVRYIQATHIKNDLIDFNRRPFYVSREWHESHERINLRVGDILIVQTGDIGKVAVVPENYGDASCHALQIARVRESVVDPWYLGSYLSSWFGYCQLKSRATGALHPHLEAGVRSSLVVIPPIQVQKELAQAIYSQRTHIDELISESEDLIALSQERRAALITAAVTGQIDVRTAT